MSSPAPPTDTGPLGRRIVPVRGQRVMPEDIRGMSSRVASWGNAAVSESTSMPAAAAELAARLDQLGRLRDHKVPALLGAIHGLLAPASESMPAARRREIGFPTRTPGRASAIKARPHKKVSP